MMERITIYKGPDESQLDKFDVDINSKKVSFRYSELVLVNEETLHPSLLLLLFERRDITRNPLNGFNAESGLSLYSAMDQEKVLVFSLGEVNRGLYEVTLEHIFDSSDIDESIRSQSYFKLKYSHDPEITGTPFPQITKFHGADVADISRAQKLREVDASYFAQKTFVAKLGAQQTDLISSSLLAYSGFFTSPNVKKIVDHDPAFYETTIQFTNDIIEAFFWVFPNAEIQFKSSRFGIRKSNGMTAFLKDPIEDENQLKQKAAETVLADLQTKLLPLSLMLKRAPDFLSMPADHALLISEKLKSRFEENEITGWEVEKYLPLIFFRQE